MGASTGHVGQLYRLCSLLRTGSGTVFFAAGPRTRATAGEVIGLAVNNNDVQEVALVRIWTSERTSMVHGVGTPNRRLLIHFVAIIFE
jgi:hypothetical protein